MIFNFKQNLFLANIWVIYHYSKSNSLPKFEIVKRVSMFLLTQRFRNADLKQWHMTYSFTRSKLKKGAKRCSHAYMNVRKATKQ